MGVLHHWPTISPIPKSGPTKLLRANGRDYRQVEQDGLFMVVVRSVHFQQNPARYDEILTLRTRA